MGLVILQGVWEEVTGFLFSKNKKPGKLDKFDSFSSFFLFVQKKKIRNFTVLFQGQFIKHEVFVISDPLF